MWLDSSGVLHAESVDDPLAAVSDDLKLRIKSASRREVRAAIETIRGYFQDLIEEVEADPGDLEDPDFEEVELPSDVVLKAHVGSGELGADLVGSIRDAPYRWRLELATVALSALFELRRSPLAWAKRRRSS